MGHDLKTPRYSSKVKAGMQTKMAPEFDANGNQTIMSMLYGTIDKQYLGRLLIEHRARMLPYKEECKAVGERIKAEMAGTAPKSVINAKVKEAVKAIPRPEMDGRLGKIISIIVDKVLGGPRFSGYTAEWKEEYRGLALEHCVRYVHNYNPEKCAKSKSGDPYNYIKKTIRSACFQKWDDLDKRSSHMQMVPLDEGILHSCIALDQYAGTVKNEKRRRHWGMTAEIGLTGESVDTAAKKADRLDEVVNDDSILPDEMANEL
jgi:hypothetical protein